MTPDEALLDAVDAELALQVPATKHRERVEAALTVPSRRTCWSTTSSRGSTCRRRVGCRAPRGPHPRRPRVGRPGHQRRGDLRRAVVAGVARRLPAPAPTTCCRPAAPRATPAACRCSRSCAASTSSSTTRDALAEVAPHIDALGGAEDLAAHVDAVRAPHPAMRAMARLDDLPLRDDLRGRTPYGAPQLDVAGPAEHQREPAPAVGRAGRRAVARAVGEAARSLNRYPDRDAVALRADLAAYLSRTTGQPLDVEQVWAANGSNEVLQQLLQAFGGPGRRGARLRADLLDAPADQPRPPGPAGCRSPRGRRLLARRPTHAVAAGRASTRPTSCSSARQQPDRHGAGPRGDRGGVRRVDADWWSSTRRTPSSRTGRRRVDLLPGRPRLVVTRTMSKAFAFAGARLGYLAADPAVVDAMRLVRLPYHLSALTQAVGPRGAGPRRRAARHGRRRGRGSATGCVARAARPRPRGRRVGRELRAVRRVRRPAGDLAGPAGPRGAGARRRACPAGCG